MPPFPALPVGRCGVVTLAELVATGWTVEAVRHAVRTGRLERLARGVFVPPASADLNRFRRADLHLLRQAVGATVSTRHTVVSHLAGALHRGLPIWAEEPHPCVCTWDPQVRRVVGLHVHRLLDPGALVTRGGVAVTSVARTVVDIACEFGAEAALVTGDAALRQRLLTRADLAAEIDRAAGTRGIEHARRLDAVLDPLSESPLESRSRWKFHLHALDPPLSQIWLHTVEGRFLGRVDHFWPEGVVGEADGTLKYLDPENRFALVEEKRRQQAMEDADLQLTRWGSRDMRDFTAAAARIGRARERARRRLRDGGLAWCALDRNGARVPLPGVGTA